MSGLTSEQINQLREYADADGTEYGEVINAMIEVLHRRDYIQNSEFEKELVEELTETLKYFEANFKWVETQETFTHKVVNLVEIE